MAAIRIEPQSVSLAGPGGGEPIQMSAVSGSLFEVLEARPALGRFFTLDEDRAPGASPVVVLSHRFWTRRFEADSSIVGRASRTSGHVGILGHNDPVAIRNISLKRLQSN